MAFQWHFSTFQYILHAYKMTRRQARSISAYWPLPPVSLSSSASAERLFLAKKPRQKHLFAKPELYIAHLLGRKLCGNCGVKAQLRVGKNDQTF